MGVESCGERFLPGSPRGLLAQQRHRPAVFRPRFLRSRGRELLRGIPRCQRPRALHSGVGVDGSWSVVSLEAAESYPVIFGPLTLCRESEGMTKGGAGIGFGLWIGDAGLIPMVS